MTLTPAARVYDRPRRFLAGLIAGGLALGATGGLLGSPAVAAEGPAPAPTDHTVLADVHTDAIATFWDDGELVLDTKADVPALGTRYDADSVWFHVDGDSRVDALPAGYDFLAPAGSTVWLAPQVQQPGQIWPGFSTESVPAGTFDGDDTTFTLVDVDGPGDVEVWLTGTFGGVGSRIWSSDEDIKRFTRKRAHMHANWGFTEPGTYELTVRAEASVGGAPVSDNQVYTFVVGELPEKVQTTTTLEVSATTIVAGDPITLDAHVEPADAKLEGSVEFRDGDHVLGHDVTDEDGNAELTVTDLGIGTHAMAAAFVPATSNLATRSTSSPVGVTVTDETGQAFEIRGVEASYAPGETLSARVAGAPPVSASDEFRWKLQYQGTTSTIVPGGRASTYSQVLSAVNDGAELQATIYDTVAKATTSSSPWVPISVSHIGGQPVVEQVGEAPAPLFPGDSLDLTVSGRPLGDGESLAWGFASYGGLYTPSLSASTWPATYRVEDRSQIHLTSRYNPGQTGRYSTPLVAYVVKDGVAISRSDFTFLTTGRRELNVAGNRTLYREGGRVVVGATTYPARGTDDFSYTWTFTKGSGANAVSEIWGTEKQASPDLTGPLLDKAAHDGGNLRLTLFNKGVQAQQSANIPIRVTDDLGSQILEFSALADHYHQGDDVALLLTADPEPLPGDTLEWQWRWPGGEWSPMAGVADNAWRVKAEQALEGLEVRAVLRFADPTREPMLSAVRTVHVDDHGGAARQQPTVEGPSSVVQGDLASFAVKLPENGQTILADHRWEKRIAGGEWAVVEGESGSALSFEAALADDGGELRVSIMKPTGEIAYGPSPAVALAVVEDREPTPTPIPTPLPTPTPTSTPTPSPTVPPVPAGPVEKAQPRLMVKAPKSVRRGAKVAIRVVVRVRGEQPTGKVRVVVTGSKRTVRLDERGRATVRVRVSRTTRPGKKKIVVTYLGNEAVARDKERATVRVTR